MIFAPICACVNSKHCHCCITSLYGRPAGCQPCAMYNFHFFMRYVHNTHSIAHGWKYKYEAYGPGQMERRKLWELSFDSSGSLHVWQRLRSFSVSGQRNTSMLNGELFTLYWGKQVTIWRQKIYTRYKLREHKGGGGVEYKVVYKVVYIWQGVNVGTHHS